jgi:hypothetical protein
MSIKKYIMNLLKSKIFLGALIAIVFVFGFVTVTQAAFTYPGVLLKEGMTHASVSDLQATLNAGPYKVALTGAGSAGFETDFFGAKTKAAVMAFQAGNGLSVDGVVGPATATKLGGAVSGNFPAGCTSAAGYSPTTGVKCDSGPSTGLPAGCSSTAGYSVTTGAKCDGSTGPNPSTGGLEGGAGDITIDGLSTYSDEDVGEGEEDVKVAVFEIEADDESDVEITSIKTEFYQADTDSSQDFDDYAESVSIWMGSDMVGEADVDEFSESSDVWTKSISLDDAIVRAGETEKFYIAISALSNLDSGDIDDDEWFVGVSSVRFMDAEGVTTTESITLDIDENAADATSGDDEVEQEFSFASSAAAADLNFKISKTNSDDADEINDAHMIDVDDTEDTDGVEVLAFTIEIEGDSDVTLDALPVEFTMVATTITNLDDSDIKGFHLLMKNGSSWDEVGSADLNDCATDSDCDTVGLTEDYTFDDLDLLLEAGDEYDFIVTVDMPGLDEDFDAGDTILATIDTTQLDQAEFDAEDENGEELAAGDTNGSAVSEASEVRDTGILVSNFESSYVKTSSDTTGINETVEFTLEFDVTAFGENAYIDDDTAEDSDGTYVATALSISVDGDANHDNISVTSWDCPSTDDVGEGFEVLEGDTEHCVVTILANGGEAGGAGTSVTFQARINNIGYNMGADGDGDVSYDLNVDELESDNVTVFDR